MKVLVTGAAGFIGFHLARHLLDRGDTVVAVDNLDPYYDVRLKEDRLALLAPSPRFRSHRIDIADAEAMERVFDGYDAVVNLAAQAGVRYSLENPHAYVRSNVVGFLNVLEGCRRHGTGHLVFASSSSVYGLNTRLPFNERRNTDHPVALYGATKKANEAMAHSYAHLFGIPCTGLRFFTVYGPWGRPDMALFKFTRCILADEPIPVFNGGHMVRDFTYVDDIVEGIVRVIDRAPRVEPRWDASCPDPATSSAPWRILNIGNQRRIELMRYIETLEKALGKKARLEMLPMQAGDVHATEADASALEAVTGYRARTGVDEGIGRFVDWYRNYYAA